jgi:hypothetical protein
MAGTLIIHSSGDPGSANLTSGHSWIEYTPDGGAATTYGTWGNNPNGLGNGLHEDLELGRTGDATRTARLTDEQEKRLFEKIKEYKDEKEDGWGYLSPCSTFAADAWEAGTGEKLSHRTLVISNPSKLKEAIEQADAAGAVAPPLPPARGSSSSAPKAGSAVQPCS